MTTTKTVKAEKTAKTTSVNGWTEENTALAITLYKEAFAVGGAELANDPSSTLKEIQEKTGAKSVVSVRSKLISEKFTKKLMLLVKLAVVLVFVKCISSALWLLKLWQKVLLMISPLSIHWSRRKPNRSKHWLNF